MAKQWRHLWREITTFDNLYLAYGKAARGKRSTAAVGEFTHRLEDNLVTLRSELHDGTYTPSAYTSFVVHDPKRRLISAAPLPDHAVS